MAALTNTTRAILRLCKRNLYVSTSKMASMPDPIEHAAGLEKRELLAKLAGNEDPFDMRVMVRGKGTKDCPNEVPSCNESRIVGCICEEDANSINWMWLHQGCPRRCYCGHWFQLTYKAPV